MRRRLITRSFLGAFLVLVLLIPALAVGCGGSTQYAVSAQTLATPQGVIQSLESAGQVTAGTGNINLTITATGDQSNMPSETQALLGQPIKLSGTYAYDQTAKAAQANVNAEIAGQTIPVAFETTSGQAWLQFIGQWYQIPANMEKAGETTTTGQGPSISSVLQALTAAGIDPTTFLTNVKQVGDETINGEATTHVSAAVDVSQIASAITKLVTSGALKNMMQGGTESTTSTAVGSSTSESVPTQQELQQIQSEITSAIQSLTLDVWTAKTSGQLRQVEVKTTVLPQAGMAQQGTTTSTSAGPTQSAGQSASGADLQSILASIKSVSLDAIVSLAPATTPLTVTPPADAKPFSDLEAALQILFSGAFGGGSTSTSAQ